MKFIFWIAIYLAVGSLVIGLTVSLLEGDLPKNKEPKTYGELSAVIGKGVLALFVWPIAVPSLVIIALADKPLPWIKDTQD